MVSMWSLDTIILYELKGSGNAIRNCQQNEQTFKASTGQRGTQE